MDSRTPERPSRVPTTGRRLLALLAVLTIAWGGVAAATATGLTPQLGLDLQGGISVILTAPEGTDQEILETAADVLENRIVGRGVLEPEVVTSGDRNILVQLPGVTDQEEALDVIGQTGELSFRPVEDARFFPVPPTVEELAELGAGLSGLDPATGLTADDDPFQPALLAEFNDAQEVIAVYRVGPAALLGTDVDEALPGQAGSTIAAGWAVNLSLTRDGADKFQDLTRNAAGQPFGSPQRAIAIVLDGRVVTAPPVSEQVDPAIGISGGQAQITTGNDDAAREEAEDLAIILRFGSLEVDLERSSLQKVSATLGADSLSAGLAAGLGGLALVAVAVVLYYRALGLVTVVGLTVFGSLLVTLFGLAGLPFFGLTLTLAGVTGIVVSIGITADSYIVYYERIKEEIHKGATVETAVSDGFRKAFRTILTADAVSFMAALLLWMLAVGPVKGFAVALGLATVLDVIVARYYTKNAVALIAGTGLADRGFLSIRSAAGASS